MASRAQDDEQVVEFVVGDLNRLGDAQGLDDLRHGVRVADDQDVAVADFTLLHKPAASFDSTVVATQRLGQRFGGLPGPLEFS